MRLCDLTLSSGERLKAIPSNTIPFVLNPPKVGEQAELDFFASEIAKEQTVPSSSHPQVHECFLSALKLLIVLALGKGKTVFPKSPSHIARTHAFWLLISCSRDIGDSILQSHLMRPLFRAIDYRKEVHAYTHTSTREALKRQMLNIQPVNRCRQKQAPAL